MNCLDLGKTVFEMSLVYVYVNFMAQLNFESSVRTSLLLNSSFTGVLIVRSCLCILNTSRFFFFCITVVHLEEFNLCHFWNFVNSFSGMTLSVFLVLSASLSSGSVQIPWERAISPNKVPYYIK